MATVSHIHRAEDAIERAPSTDQAIHRALVVVDPPMAGHDVAAVQRATRDRLLARGIGGDDVPVPQHGRFTTATALACVEAQYRLGLAPETYLRREDTGHLALTEGAQRMIRDPSSRGHAQLDRARQRRARLERGLHDYEDLAAKMSATGTGVAGALEFACKQRGAREQPSGSCWGPQISTWIDAAGYCEPVPWSGCFVNACLMAGGLASGAGWVGYIPAIVGHARSGSGGWPWPGPPPGRPGDLALFATRGDHPAVHVEIVRAALGPGRYSTFGVNTSDGRGAGRCSGAMVARRDDRGVTGALPIIGFARPPWKR